MKLIKITKFITKIAGRKGLVLQKNAPAIFVGLGLAAGLATVICSSKATIKAHEVLKQHDIDMATIKKAGETTNKKYTEQEFMKDKTIQYKNTVVELIRLYTPSVALGCVSVACIIGGHTIITKRNLGLVAAYKLAQKSFDDYRGRVVEEFGSDKDRQLKHGITKETITTSYVDEKGKVKTGSTEVDVFNTNHISQYARFFDETSTMWSKMPGYNQQYVKVQQSQMNDLLKSRGHVFLNDVYDVLGFERTSAGAVVGWLYNDGGDNFIDFNMYDAERQQVRAFVNEQEHSILLDFNVDGVIHDLI